MFFPKITDIMKASVDVFYSFYNRPRFSEEDFNELVCPMYRHETINLLSRIYEWAWIDADDIDSEKYLLAKKFSEVIDGHPTTAIASY